MRQVFLAGALGAAQCGFGVLHERIGVVAIVGITRESAFHVDGNSAPIHVERRAEHFDHLFLHPVHGFVFVAGGFHDETKRAAAEMRQQLGRVQVALESIRHLLQQLVADVPAE